MVIKIMLQFNGKNLTIPINPEEITIEQEAENTDINIVGLGNATKKGEPGLKKVTIESFFPAANSYFYTGVKPKSCVDFIWKTENKNNNVGKIITIGLPTDINMYFVIDNFKPQIKAGEEEDIYYTLSIKQYIPYGVKTIKIQNSGLNNARASSTATQTASAPVKTNKTYKVVRGDCLWNITKKFTGNGSRWRELYNLNKSVIGANPNLIYPNQVLTLPIGW